jgi:alkanesulfonate monooxygenase SsuD/methylene tetrahydromethanopterin reductase-like flavin-dependent oxidoreductase (luciferase family)
MDSRWTASLGVALLGHGIPASTVGWAREAERAGLGSLWIIEDYFHPGAFALAGAAAAATERIGIGLGVVNPYTRHPALLAMETAALAGLAPGRVALGLGSSNRRWIEEQMAVPFKTPLRGVREGVDIVRRLLAGERVTYAGECFSVNGVKLEAPPSAPVPIVLGVKGPRALGLAAEIADGVHCSILTSPAHVRRVRSSTAVARVGRRFVVVAYVPMAVSDDGREARARVRPLLAHYLGALHGQSILADAGLDPARTQPFHDAQQSGRGAAELVTDEMVDTLAVAGTPDECRRALARLAEAGLDAPVAVLPAGVPLTEQLRQLGDILVPAWRELTPRSAQRRTA